MRRLLRILCGMAMTLAATHALTAAADPLRVGKSANTVFSYTLLDVGLRQGIFRQHGLEIEATGFGGGPKLMSALLAGSSDIGISTGPDMALLVKGAPMKAVGVLSGRPDEMALLILDNPAVHGPADLKGRRIGVTAAASLTGWLVRQLSLQQGWGPDGIQLVQVANGAPSMALLRTGQIDGVAQDMLSCLEGERAGLGHVMLNFGSVVPAFHTQMFFATDAVIAAHPEQVRAFLAGWYDTIAWVHGHKAETVAIVADVLGRDPALTARVYDQLLPDYSTDGRFDPKALAVLANSFVDLGLVETPPDLSRVIDTNFLPGAAR